MVNSERRGVTRETASGTTSDPSAAPSSPVADYLGRLAPSSQRAQRTALDAMAGLLSEGTSNAAAFEWHTLTPDRVERLVTVLSDKYAPVTVHRMVVALRGTLKAAWRRGLMDAQAYQEATAVRPIRWSTLPRGRLVSDSEIAALFAACANDDSPAGPRDAALLTALYAAGLRRSEAAALDLKDYDPTTGALSVGATLKSRARTLYTVRSTAQAFDRWLAVRGSEAGPIFVAINKGGRFPTPPERMHEHSVYRALVKRAQQAGLTAFSCQDLRRTFITRLLEGGADIATVQRLAGHCSLVTTQRYDRRSEEVHRQAARMLSVPEFPPSIHSGTKRVARRNHPGV